MCYVHICVCPRVCAGERGGGRGAHGLSLYCNVPFFFLLLPVIHLSKPKPLSWWGSEEHRHFTSTMTITVPWRWEVSGYNIQSQMWHFLIIDEMAWFFYLFFFYIDCFFIDYFTDWRNKCSMCILTHTRDPCVNIVHLKNNGYNAVCGFDRLCSGCLYGSSSPARVHS